MVKAVVYLSKTGHAKRYAEMFAAKVGLPCYEAGEASKHLAPGAEIIYFGWMMAGSVKGYEKAAQSYAVEALAAVGMRFAIETAENEIRERYHTGDLPVFYLTGGVDTRQLGWVYRQSLSFAGNMLMKAAAKEDATPETIQAAKDFELDKDYVSELNLQPLLTWYQAQ
jgi:hypothetical protein